MEQFVGGAGIEIAVKGDEVREHKPDEFMEISRLLDNAAIFAKAMYELAKD